MVRKSVLTLGGTARETSRVALLRGINVGKAKRIAMSDLRDVAEGLGWGNVTTLLATGNLVFTPSGTKRSSDSVQLARALEQSLAKHHQLEVRTVVLSCEEVTTVIEEMPFGSKVSDPSRLMVAAYVDPGARAKLEALLGKNWSPGEFALGRHAAYMWCPDGILESALAAAVTKATRDGLTTRNWSTWQKIHRLAAATSTPADGQRSRISLREG